MAISTISPGVPSTKPSGELAGLFSKSSRPGFGFFVGESNSFGAIMRFAGGVLRMPLECFWKPYSVAISGSSKPALRQNSPSDEISLARHLDPTRFVVARRERNREKVQRLETFRTVERDDDPNIPIPANSVSQCGQWGTGAGF